MENMRRIEIVIQNAALDRFTEVARALRLCDFDVAEVRRTPPAHTQQRQRLYRGHAFTLDLVDRLKIDLNVSDEAVREVARALVEGVNPEALTILRLDQASVVEDLIPASVSETRPSERGNSAIH